MEAIYCEGLTIESAFDGKGLKGFERAGVRGVGGGENRVQGSPKGVNQPFK